MSETTGPKPSPMGDADLEALKTRMHVYESFDSVISEQIAGAKHILFEAAELRERVTREVTLEREALNAEIADKRARLAAEFVGLRTSFDADLQARRDEFESELASRSASVDDELAATRRLIEDEHNRFAAAQAKIAATAQAILGMIEGKEPSSALVADPATSVAEPAEPIITSAPVVVPEPEQPATESAPPVIAEVPVMAKSEPAKTTIIIHGISRPAVATGLQRFLLSKDGVISVEPREFAEGILRLQIRATTPITEALFTGWSDGDGMTVIQRLPQTVEIVLPTVG